MERILVIFNMPGLEMLDITISGELNCPEEANVSGVTQLSDCKTKKRYIIPTTMIAYMECEEINNGE